MNRKLAKIAKPETVLLTYPGESNTLFRKDIRRGEMHALTPETHLGRFKLVGPLGKGGMGEVWKALDPRLSREVAIKVLPAELANPDLRIRFERESRILAALNHPNIAQIYEAGEETPVTSGVSAPGELVSFLVMEYIDGRSLAQMLSAGPLPVLTTIRLGRQIARALGAAHKAGIIHRDLKPANIMVTSRNQVKVLDFGLARPTGHKGGGVPTLPDVTVSGVILGTAAYLSPEQVKGEPADIRSDIWALGCVLYQMLTGRRPFPGESIPEILVAVLRDEPEDMATLNQGVPAPLAAVVNKCFSKDPNSRPQSAFEIAAVLKDIFHQVRPGSPSLAAPSADSLDSGEVQPNLRNIENINRYLKMVNPSYPQFPLSAAGPSYLEVAHRGTKVGILFATKERDGGDVLAFVCPLFPLPAANRGHLYKRLLSLSNGHSDVAQYSVDTAGGTVNATCVRACDSIDPFQFQHTLDMLKETADMALPLRKEFGIT